MHKICLYHRKNTWFPLVVSWHDHNKEDSAAMLAQGTSPTSSAQPFRCPGVTWRAPEPGRRQELILTGGQQILSECSQHISRDTSPWDRPGAGRCLCRARSHIRWELSTTAPAPPAAAHRRQPQRLSRTSRPGLRSRSPPTSLGTFAMRPVMSAVSTAKSCS